ncbi:hypothetical protein ACTMU2_13985 [Cupriavidus basilensis]
MKRLDIEVSNSADAELLGGCVKVVSYDRHGNVTATITTESADGLADAAPHGRLS